MLLPKAGRRLLSCPTPVGIHKSSLRERNKTTHARRQGPHHFLEVIPSDSRNRKRRQIATHTSMRVVKSHLLLFIVIPSDSRNHRRESEKERERERERERKN